MTLRGFFSHVGAEQRDVLDDGQTGLDEEAPHHIFVHAGRRAQHAGADVGDAGQLEESLDGAVLAEGAVQHGKDHIEGLAARALALVESCGRTGLGREQRGNAFVEELCSGRGFGVAGAQPPRHCADVAVEQVVGVCRGQPAALFGDADRSDVESVAVNGPQNRRSREQRNLVLAAAPAKKYANTKLFCHFFSSNSLVAILAATSSVKPRAGGPVRPGRQSPRLARDRKDAR